MAREPTAIVQLKVRMRESLRAILEEAARKRAVSLNAEIVDRLTSTLEQDRLYGGADILRNMSAAFLAAAEQAAIQRGHRNRDSEAWISEPVVFEAASRAAIEYLLAWQPDGAWTRLDSQKEYSNLIRMLANRAGLDVQITTANRRQELRMKLEQSEATAAALRRELEDLEEHESKIPPLADHELEAALRVEEIIREAEKSIEQITAKGKRASRRTTATSKKDRSHGDS